MIVKMGKILKNIEELALIVIMIFSTIIVGISVFMRYIMNSPLSWCEEIVCYFQIWLAFIGTAYISRKSEDYISFDFIVHRLNDKKKLLVSLLSSTILFIFSTVMSFVCIQWIVHTFQYGGVSTPMKVPNYIPRIIVPIAFVLLTIQFFKKLISDIRATFKLSKNVESNE